MIIYHIFTNKTRRFLLFAAFLSYLLVVQVGSVRTILPSIPNQKHPGRIIPASSFRLPAKYSNVGIHNSYIKSISEKSSHKSSKIPAFTRSEKA